MDRGAWQVPAHGIPRVGHDLALSFILSVFICFTISATHTVSATTYLDTSVWEPTFLVQHSPLHTWSRIYLPPGRSAPRCSRGQPPRHDTSRMEVLILLAPSSHCVPPISVVSTAIALPSHPGLLLSCHCLLCVEFCSPKKRVEIRSPWLEIGSLQIH